MKDYLLKISLFVYNHSIRELFECAKLYKIDLNEIPLPFPTLELQKYDFYVFKKGQSHKPEKFYENLEGKMVTVKKRISSGNYLCFAFNHKESGNIAYARWLCKDRFYSETLKKQLIFSEDEALTLDSYTHPEYRNLGLHREMNMRMLNWIKEQTEIRNVYMVIRCFIPHLTRIPLMLGYRPIETICYYKKGSLSYFIKKLWNKVNHLPK